MTELVEKDDWAEPKDPKKKYFHVYNRKACIGAGACVQASAKAWKMAGDNKADCTQWEFDEADLELNMNAAQACPVDVIKIKDKDGKWVYEG